MQCTKIHNAVIYQKPEKILITIPFSRYNKMAVSSEIGHDQRAKQFHVKYKSMIKEIEEHEK